MITAAILTSRSFIFCYHDDRPIISSAYFLPNRLVVGPRLEEVHRWDVVDGTLLLKDVDGHTTGRLKAADETLSMVGSFFKRMVDGQIREFPCQVEARGCDLPDARVPTGNFTAGHAGKRAAVLIRTHVLDDKVLDLLRVTEHSSRDVDVFILCDRTNGQPDTDLENLIWHSAAECANLGLSQVHHRLLWWCGDFAFYFGMTERPGYAYYAMVEYDVHFTGSFAAFFGRLLSLMESGRIDAVGTRLRLEERREGGDLHRAAFGHFDTVYSFFFPFIVLSRPAVSYLLSLRRQEAMRCAPGEDILYCESFVPTALMDAGFSCLDLNTLLPGCYENDLMIMPNRILGSSLSLGSQFAAFSEIIHPVYSDVEYLRRVLSSRAVVPTIRTFIRQLASDDFGSIAVEVHDLYQHLAEEKLLVAPDVRGNVNLASESMPVRAPLEMGKWYSAVDVRLRDMFLDGWSVPEHWGVWGIGSSHDLKVVVPTAEEHVLLDLDLEGFSWDENAGRPVDIYLDGDLVKKIVFAHLSRRSSVTLLLNRPKGHGNAVIVKLRPAQVVVPMDVLPAISDDRPLGVALHHVRFRSG